MKHTLLIFALMLLTSCTSLFFHPTKDVYYDVDATKIDRQELTLTTADNLKLNGWYFPQKDPKALVLFFHGNAQNITSHFVTLFWFTQADYDYALFDYRGYGKSEGTVKNDKLLLDIKAMMDWGIQQSTQRKIPLVIYGQSMGANLALKYLSLHPEIKPSLLIVEAPFYKFTEIAKIKASEVWLFWPLQPFVSLLISDKNSLNEKDLATMPNYPKIFIHSENDPVVPFSQGQKTFEYISDPKELWTYKAPHHVNGTHTEEGKYRYLLLDRLEAIHRKPNKSQGNK
jgi:pimeloyl-ACP methyl ester carboxylesterase